jgi:aspartyl-tRNA(Asn)/glutamyl-tRNA(Gln) amidotransferase subunit B
MHNYKMVIGLEVHAKLKTHAKLFSSSATDYGMPPNAQASLIDLAMPGTLPVVNKAAIDKAICFGIAVDATIAAANIFARKHYFYPDLSKGYQISQYKHPIVSNGKIAINIGGQNKIINLERAHLEEDAGKLTHDSGKRISLIDYNRAGTPLLEIVSKPEINSAEEAIAYLKELHYLLRYYDICDGNMEQGSFRCDVNISLRKNDSDPFGTRVEIKNLNSFRFITSAIKCEHQRQAKILAAGAEIVQATVLYDPEKDETRIMRLKEEAADYRYFTDPDLPTVYISADRIAAVAAQMPITISKRMAKLNNEYNLKTSVATELMQQINWLDKFEQAAKHNKDNAAIIANWILQDIPNIRHDHPEVDNAISAQHLTELATAVANNKVSKSHTKAILLACCQHKMNISAAIEHLDICQICDPKAITAIIDTILREHPEQCAAYQAGETKMLIFFLGQVMKESSGKADPKLAREILIQQLK